MSLYYFTARIANVLAAGDIVVWDPPLEEVDFYLVRIYFKSSANKRAGQLSRNAPKNRPWLEISQTFTDPSPIQGVQYYFQVHAHSPTRQMLGASWGASLSVRRRSSCACDKSQGPMRMRRTTCLPSLDS